MEKNKRTPGDYADIIDLPYDGARRHARMPMEKRAAQFSPFAALTGYEDAVDAAVVKAEADAENVSGS